jgi:hypothetical protein
MVAFLDSVLLYGHFIPSVFVKVLPLIVIVA